MIKPDKHTNLDASLINIASFILNEFQDSKNISYDKLLENVINSLGEDVKELYPYSINFLYLLGKISYQQNTDTFSYNEIK